MSADGAMGPDITGAGIVEAEITGTCPCCGAPVRVAAWDAALAVLSPIERRVAEVARRRPGVSVADLVDLVYRDDPDGGPLTALRSIQSLICRGNKKLRRFGFAVSAGMGSRYGYRVVTVEVGA